MLGFLADVPLIQSAFVALVIAKNSYGAATSLTADADGTSAVNMVSTMSAVNVTAVIFLFISFPPNYFYWLYLPADAGLY